MVADIFTVFFHTWRRLTKYSKLILLFSLPIIFIYIILKPIFPEYTSVTDFLTYTCIFIYGYVFKSKKSPKNGTFNIIVANIISTFKVLMQLVFKTKN